MSARASHNAHHFPQTQSQYIFDHFGFVAEHIGSSKSDAFTATLTLTKDAAFELSPTTGDVSIREV